MSAEGDFDVIVLGTGLTESITAAALAKAGFKVAHVDTNSYYGGDEASLSLDELVQWADSRALSSTDNGNIYMHSQRSRFSSISHSPFTGLPQSRQYSISLAPSIIPSVGPLITSLVSSGVSRYGGFRLLERVAIYDPSGAVKNVPGNKEDVFKNADISLLDKRRLMRFLLFAASDFEGKKELEQAQLPYIDFLKSVFKLNGGIANAIAYSLSYCVSPSEETLPALQRTRRYLRSAGRYGPSSFLIGHYGSTGEIAQGFCRTAAVGGSVYILGRRITSITSPIQTTTSSEGLLNPQPRYNIELDDFPEPLTCDVIVASQDYVPPHLYPAAQYVGNSVSSQHSSSMSSMARCIALIDRQILFAQASPAPQEYDADPELTLSETRLLSPQEIDTAILVFPPSSLSGGSTTTSVNVLITGEGSMSTPKGKWIVYIAMPLQDEPTSSPQALLEPYLNATLALTRTPLDQSPCTPLFSLFYVQHPSSPLAPLSSKSSNPSSLLVTTTPVHILPELSDAAASNADSIFWETVKSLKSSQRVALRRSAETGRDGLTEVESLWPPLDVEADEDEEAW